MANNENLENRKPFPKGVSGNPKGRPPKTITAIMRELGEGALLVCKYGFLRCGEFFRRSIDLESLENKRKYKATINEIVGSQVIKQAIAGDVASQKLLIEAQNPTVSVGNESEKIQPPNVTFTRENMSNEPTTQP